MLALLTLFALNTQAAEIEVSGVTLQYLRIDGQRVMPMPGSTTLRKRNLPGGTHTVRIENAIGKEITSLNIELAPDEGVRFDFAKKTLEERARYEVEAPDAKKPRGGGDGDSDAGSPDALTIDKKGIFHNYVWVDSVAQGRVKNRKGLSVPVGEGSHEVWVALSEDAVWTWCHGMAERGSTISLTARGCEGLSTGMPDSGSMFRGATATVAQGPGINGWISIDAGTPMSVGGRPTELNLSPGQHSFTLTSDAFGSATYAQGTFTLTAGVLSPIQCTTLGCVGLDQPPVPFTPVQAQASSSSSSSSGERSSGAGGGGGDNSCCVNGSYYSCPSADAVYTCTGAYMVCLMNCDMMDPSCMDTCESEHPIDPSECDRDMSRDDTCD